MAATAVPEPVERYRAQQILLAASIPVGKVYRVFTPGDLLAECDASGRPRITILFTSSGEHPEPMTALLMEDGSVVKWEGWNSVYG